MFRMFTSVRGFSAAEATIVLSTVSILAAATAPTLGDYVNQAREARARDEVRVVANAVSRMTSDLLSRSEVAGGIGKLTLVVSEGDVPTVGSGADSNWAASSSSVGSLNEHLMSNAIGYAVQGSNLPRGIKGWSGPYIDRPLGADPWGHRYAVRLGQGKVATLVLSAGPDGVINTVDSGNGLVVGGDDIVSVISGR
jgi:type II secretory pathway pseudopilin PulG